MALTKVMFMITTMVIDDNNNTGNDYDNNDINNNHDNISTSKIMITIIRINTNNDKEIIVRFLLTTTIKK